MNIKTRKDKLKYIKRLTQYNFHTAAIHNGLDIVNMDHKRKIELKTKLKEIASEHTRIGFMSEHSIRLRSQIQREMMACARKNMSQENYRNFYMSY